MYKICIDPGHGGTDPGAVNGAAREKDIVLDVGLKLKALLEKAGHKVVMTREHDFYATPIAKAQVANAAEADIFISLHCNGHTQETANGTEVWFYTGSEDGEKLAKCLQEKLIKRLGRRDRGIKHRKDLIVLNSTKMTAALVEIAFITNMVEKLLLINAGYRSHIANAIFEGIQQYLGVDDTNTEGSVKSQQQLKKEAVQKGYEFSDKTIAYLAAYEFAEELIDRLYKNMKK